MNITQQLKDMEEQIEEAKNYLAKDTGALEEKMKQLKELKVDSIEKAKQMIKALNKKKQSMEVKLEKGVKLLLNEYEWE